VILGIGGIVLWALMFLRGILRYALSLLGVYAIDVALILGEDSRVGTKRKEIAVGGIFVAAGLLLMVLSGGRLDKLGALVGFGGLFLSTIGSGR